METIQKLQEINLFTWIITAFMILAAIIAIYEIICKFCAILGKPIGIMKQRKADHELTLQNTKALQELSARHEEDTKQSIKHDEMIRNDLTKLTKMFIDKQIDDMRYEILDFASSLSSGRTYNKEQFDHIIQIDEKYQRILEQNDMENGQVTVSMEYINEMYRDKLKNGF